MTKYIMNSMGFVTKVKENPELNAYELASFVESHDCEYLEQDAIPKMLRMQADEITALRKQIDELSN